jgi:DNA-binding beta-propeller fold protein YncE
MDTTTRLAHPLPIVCMLVPLLLGACGGGGDDGGGAMPPPPAPIVDGDPNAISDTDAAPDRVLESAVAGTPVGLALALASSGTATVEYSLRDNAGGAFSIDPSSGIVRVASGVDFEAGPTRTIIVQAAVGQGTNRRTWARPFAIEVLDSPAPTFQITFPFAHARFSDAAISVSGTVSHPQPASLSVSASAGGAVVQGQVSNGTFQVRDIPVSGNGNFTLTITVSHPGGDTTTQQLTLSREPELTDVARMVLDEPKGRVLLLDRNTRAIVAAPLDGGPRSIVSGRQVGAGPAFVDPIAITMDPADRSLYVVDAESKAVFRVDAAGDRSWLTGIGPGLFSPTDLDFDSKRQELLLSDEQAGILAISLVTGAHRLVSSGSSPGPTIYYHRGVGFDAARDRILTTDTTSLFAVDPVTGTRTMISDGIVDPVQRFIGGMTVASQAGFAYLADEFANGVVRVDLLTGARQTITSSGLALFNYPPVGSGTELQYPADVVLTSGNRLFLIEGEYADPLVEVLSNGDRITVRDAALGKGVNFRGPQGLKFDATRRVLLVSDYVADFVAEIDPSTGDRTLITGRSDGRGTIDHEPMDAAMGAADQYYYVDFATDALYAVRTGEAPRHVSDAATGSGPAFDAPIGVEIDAAHGLAYVIDIDAVFSVDLATGERSVIDAGPGQLSGLTADFQARKLFVAELGGGVFSIDLATGTRQNVPLPAGMLTGGGIAHDAATHSLLVVNQYPRHLERIDEAGASRTTVDAMAPACGPTLERPRGVAVDSARQVAYVTDDAFDGIIAVDLRTGCRQLIAK